VGQFGQGRLAGLRADPGDQVGEHAQVLAVVEGVEDDETWQEVKSLGCSASQGFLFSRPLPAVAAMEWINAWRAVHVGAGVSASLPLE